jgi:tRNA threonylcarbamoyladenosine biosynthesis protein TsaE
LNVSVANADEMRALGARLAQAICSAEVAAPLVIGLSGDLGAGKTTLAAGLLEALGHRGPVRSPTYTLVEPYRLAGRDVYHCDLYRLRAPEELDDLGIRDLLVDRGILLVEWPERAGDRLAATDLSLHLGYLPMGRKVRFNAETATGVAVLDRLRLDQS